MTETPISSEKSINFEDSEQRLKTLDYLKVEKISTNIITKRILVDKFKKRSNDSTHFLGNTNSHFNHPKAEEKRLFKSENKRKLKRYKKSEIINIKLENTERNLEVNHKCKNKISYKF